jgi:hypothetical protein
MKKIYLVTMSLLMLIPAGGAFAAKTPSEKQDTLVERFQTEPPTPDEELQIALKAENTRVLTMFFNTLKAAHDAEIARQAAEQVQESNRAAKPKVTLGGGSIPSGGCSGGILPDYITNRESRGRCDAVNPTGCGGRGCIGDAQVDRGHFYADSPWGDGPGSCYGLGYADCVNKLSNGGTNLDPWKCC